MNSRAVLSYLPSLAAGMVVLAGIGVLAHTQSQSSGAPQGQWSTKAPLPAPRLDAGAVAVNGKLYVLGGDDTNSSATRINQEYDPVADHWRGRAPIPRAASHIGVAADDGKIYVVGGFTAIVHASPLDKVFAYDVAADTWRELPPISSPRGSIGAAVVGGKLHAVGGRGPNNVTVGTHEVYDPATRKWTQAAPLPNARDHFGIVVVDGKIHVLGGRISGHVHDNSKPAVPPIAFIPENNGDNTSLHDVYDPATDSWQSAAPLPTARSNGAAVYYNGLILYAGGECKKPNPKGGGDTFSENEAYDPKTNRWLTLSRLPAGHQGFGAGAIGASAYFVSGSLGCGGGPMTDQGLAFHLP